MRSPCLEPHCPNLASYRGRCPEHAKQRDRSINRQGKKVYRTKAWQILRRRVLSEQPICNLCNLCLAKEVDHINGNPQDNSRANLQGLCSHCHGVKTRGEMAA